jgi:hypothetical protein
MDLHPDGGGSSRDHIACESEFITLGATSAGRAVAVNQAAT